MKKLTALSILLLGASCVQDNNSEPSGLRLAFNNGGATAKFDLEHRPLPKIPFPNDIATTVDPTSKTGRRINVSTMAATELERDVRRKINKLEGFSILPQITVEFDKPLDPHNIVKRHHELVPDFSDDVAYLVNVDEASPEFGEFTLLDLGRGNYPITMSRPDKYFDFDPRRQGTNLVFESVQEIDENGNGVLDPLEDTDDDGVWDVPNTLNPGADPLDPGEMMVFYERETNTVVMRPVMPLREQTKYAVVITDKLLDEQGFPVNSPWKYINHTRQTDDLEPLRRILPAKFPERFDADLKGVQMAWSFTTQATTQSLLDIRAGLYGEGKFDWLAERYPAEMNFAATGVSTGVDGNRMLTKLAPAILGILVDALAGGTPAQDREALISIISDVDYFVAGSYTTPYFLVDKDGMQGSDEEVALNQNVFDEDEVFDINLQDGTAVVGEDEVPFLCAVPKALPGREPPFPVAIYGHGYGSSKIESLGFAGQMAKFGIATCAIDNTGHGLAIPAELADSPLVSQVLQNTDLENLIEMLEHGRHRDLGNDGVPDSGADYWVSDLFHLRDNVRQTTIDYMQFIRLLRNFDGDRQWPNEVDNVYSRVRPNIVSSFDADGDGQAELAGDFNGDGVIDFGGEQPVYAFGISLGGIQSSALVGVDPVVRAAAPGSGASGLLDTGTRSSQSGVQEAVFLPFFGPLVLGRPVFDYNDTTGAMEDVGRYQFEFLVNTGFDESYVPFAMVDGLEHGDQVVVRNLNREKNPDLVEEGTLTSRVTVRRTGFRTGIASDAWSANERRAALGFDTAFDAKTLQRRAGPAEEGLRVEIFQTASHRTLRGTQVTPNVDETWAAGETPLEGLNPANHSMVFHGVLRSAEDRTIRLSSTGGRARLSVDGAQVLDVREGAEDAMVRFDGMAKQITLRFDRGGAEASLKLAFVDGTDEVTIPASAFETHLELSADEQQELDKHRASNAQDWGDPIVVEIYGQDGELKRTIENFEMSTYFQNIQYPADTPLAALAEGWGQRRQSPGLRQFLSIGQMIIDAGDPAAFGRHWFAEPLDYPYETEQFQKGGSNVMVVPTIGDTNVPISNSIAGARFAGIIDVMNNHPDYGMTENQFLVQNYVYEGVHWLNRFPNHPNTLFDPDDLDEGAYRWEDNPDDPDPNVDAERPLRPTVTTDFGMSGMRIPYMRVEGEHGWALPSPSIAFDIDSYIMNVIGYYFVTGGQELVDDICMEDLNMDTCTFFDKENYERPTFE